jgi:hypothetical protein
VRAYDSLNLLVADIGSNPAYVTIVGQPTVDGDLTIPADYVLDFKGPASMINVVNGVLTIETRNIFSAGNRSEGSPLFDAYDEDKIRFFIGLGNDEQMVLKTWWFGGFGGLSSMVSNWTAHIVEFTESYAAPEISFNRGIITRPDVILAPSSTGTVGAYFHCGPWECFGGDGAWTFNRSRLDSRWFGNSLDSIVSKIGNQAYIVVEGDLEPAQHGLVIPSTITLDLTSGSRVDNSNGHLEFQGTVITRNAGWYIGDAPTVANHLNLSNVLAHSGNIYDILSGALGTLSGNKIRITSQTIFDPGYDPYEALVAAQAAGVDAQQALEDVVTANARIDGKVKFFYQAVQPSSGMVEGDLWMDTDSAKNQFYVYTGGIWVNSRDKDIAAALELAQGAAGGLQSKITIYWRETAPGGTSYTDGDMWIKISTDDTYIWSYADQEWQLAISGSTVYRGATAPANPKDGKLWFDTTLKVLKRWDAAEGGWDVVGDETQTKIDDGLITTGSIVVKDGAGIQQAGMTGDANLGSDIRFWAGDTYANRTVAPFRVTDQGYLTASRAIFVYDEGSGTEAGIIMNDLSNPKFYTQVNGNFTFRCILGGTYAGNVYIGRPTGSPADEQTVHGLLYEFGR